ncbi:EAL domain-containing protein [Shewanella sedimentimangrovi]|uniref:EAL domain-containing protein n=1 Tax=Shewanella sedimentimangrovi TaxID=2814293 RepID=A0ABX7QWS0_9GAMM|nr:EAL domain-containing protein [Shewanella sedimentimangrovi]QSX35952.1 EAL domain-containing protein [Shewanella sedimentimangrovi]
MQKALSHFLKLLLMITWSVSAYQEATELHPYDASLMHLNADVYSTLQGLSQNTVTSVVEDKNGYIWLGTLNGLNRFDGNEFKKYYSEDYTNLSSSFIHSLEFFNEKLMIGTDSNLLEMDPDTEKFEVILEVKEPITFLQKHDDNLFIGSSKSIKVLDSNSKITLDIKDDKIDFVKQIIKFENYYLIRNHNGTVLKVTASKNVIEVTKDSISIGNNNGRLLIDRTDGTYEYINGQLVKLNNATYDSVTYSSSNKISIKNNIVKVMHGELTTAGVIDSTFSLLSPLIFQVDNGIIIASMNNGFLYVQDYKNIVKTGTVQKNSNIWFIANYKNNLLIADETTRIKIYNSNNLEISNEIETETNGFKALAVINDNEIVYCSSKGIFKYTTSSGDHTKISERIAYSLAYSEKNNKIYIGTDDLKLISIDINNFNEEILKSSNLPIFQLKVSNSNNNLYISHQGGLSIMKNNSTAIDDIITKHIVYGVEFLNEDIVIATENGIIEYNEPTNSIKPIVNTDKPIYSLGIYDGWIFGSSISNITVITPEKVYTLQSSNGAQGEYNNQGFGVFRDGVVLGGIQGISIINKKEFQYVMSKASERLNTNLTGLYLFNKEIKNNSEIISKSVDSSEIITLKYSDYPFAIQFSSPKYSSTNVTHFYRLQGLSDEWISAQKTKVATYTNLSPGKYSFEVYARDNLSQISGPIKSISVVITPPWWMSTQAKIAYALLMIIILAIIAKAILRRREVQRQIAISEERLKLSLWGSGDEMWDWDIETGKIYRSNIWGSLEFPRDGQRSGASDEESNIHPLDQERVREALNRHFYGETDHFEAAYRVKSKDDHWLWILDRAKIVERDDKDQALRMTGTIKNINQFKLAEEQLRLFERAIENISEGMFILDSDFRFVEVNDACCNLCQQDREQFIGSQFNFQRYPESFSAQIRALLKQQGRWTAEVEAARGDGSFFLMELTVDAIYDEQGDLSHYVGVFSDISRRKQQEEELRKLTNNDLLTGLPNRSNLQVTLGNLVKKDTHHTLMVLDLDNFKKINDSLGHKVGDDLLLMVSERILATVPDHTSLYRLGGDEFAILIDKNPDIGSSAAIAHRVIDAFKLPFELADEKLVIGCSIGIVFYPEDEQNEQALLRKADIAMYHAKSAGGNRYQFYSESLNRNAIRQLEIENLIREGLRDDLFEVYYQPKIDLKRSCLAGMEALVRLNHPVHGLIPPSDFIPLAEDTGLIIEIGELVMRKACFAAQKWREKGLFNGRVAINLSSRQFALPDLQQRIESILRLTQLPAANLELEITEGTVIKQPEKAIKVMQQLSKMGVNLALDDFGTGYSSLSYLKRFPIHSLKIDKAFVDDIDKSDRDLKMVDSIITIAHNMGLTVVGEGVEVPSQLNILRALNCEEIQGYIYSKALPEDEFGALLEQDMAEFLSQRLSANSR